MKKNFTSDNFYSENYNSKDWREQREKDAIYLVNRIRDFKVLTNKSKVLDAGCGSGELAVTIKKQYNAEVYGMDLNKVAVQHAIKRGVKANIVDLDKKWPHKNNFFDCVTATEIIEHVINPDHLLLEAKRVLKPGGYVVIQTPNLACWFNRVIFLFGYQPFFTEVSTIDKTIGLRFTQNLTPRRETLGHIRVFTLFALKDILEMHGFDIIGTQGNTVYYLPKYMAPFDKLFSYIPWLATDMTVVAKKRNR